MNDSPMDAHLRWRPAPGAPSALELDRLEGGEYDAAGARALQARIDAQPDLQALQAERAAAARRFEALMPRDAFVQALSQSPPPAPGLAERLMRWLRALSAPKLMGALALAALLLVLPRLIEPGRDGSQTARLKGAGATLKVLQLEGDRVSPLRSGGVAHPGAALQFAVVSGGRPFAMLVNLDDTGAFTSYFPEGSGASIRLEGAEPSLLPGAIELDDFIGSERLVLLLSDAPLHTDDVEAAALAWVQAQPGGALSLRDLDLAGELDAEGGIPGVIQLNFDLIKERRP